MTELKYQNNEELVLQYQNGDDYAFTELFEINQGLIRELMNKYNHIKILDDDTKISACYKGFVSASKNYSKEKETKFSSYCMKIMEREIFKELTYTKQRGRDELIKNTESANRMIPNNDGETEAIYLIDAKIQDEYFEGSQLIAQGAINYAMSNSKSKFKKYIIPIICDEYSQSEIAEMFNTTRQSVQYQVRRFERMMRDYMEFNNINSIEEALN